MSGPAREVGQPHGVSCGRTVLYGSVKWICGNILSFFVIIVDTLRCCFSGLYEAEVLVNEQSGLNCFFGDSIIGFEGLAG